MVQLVAVAAVNAAISFGIGKVSALLSKSKTAKQDQPTTVAQDPLLDAKRVAMSLSARSEPSGPQIGIFGNRRVGGRIVVDGKSGTKTYMAIVIAGAPVTAINAVYINNKLVTIDGSDTVTSAPWVIGAAKAIRIKLYTGTQVAADPWLLAAFPGSWTAQHIGTKCAYAVIEMNPAVAAGFADVFAPGVPDFTFDVYGFPVYDPRNGAHVLGNPATWTYGTGGANPVLHWANYRIHELGAALPTSEVDWADIATKATICDQAVSLKLGGTEPRYSCSAYWTTDMRHEAVLELIESTFAGGPVSSGRKSTVWVGAYDAPAETVTPDTYAGDGLTVTDAVQFASRVNGVRASFLAATENYEIRDIPSYQDATALAADGGVAEWLDLDLSFVRSHTQAQRVARIAYNRQRFAITGRLHTTHAHFDVIEGDTLAITDTLASFTAETVKITDCELQNDMTISFDFRGEKSSFYNWTPASDEAGYSVATPLDGRGSDLGIPGGSLYAHPSISTSGRLHIYINRDTPATSILFRQYSGPTTYAETVLAYTPTVDYLLSPSFAIGTTPRIDLLYRRVTGGVTEDGTPLTIYSGAGNPVLTGLTETSTTFKALPSAPMPILYALGSGAAQLQLLAALNCPNCDAIQLWENTTNSFGTATLINTTGTNVDTTVSVSGTIGTVKYYWIRYKKNTGPAFGPQSPTPLLIAF